MITILQYDNSLNHIQMTKQYSIQHLRLFKCIRKHYLLLMWTLLRSTDVIEFLRACNTCYRAHIVLDNNSIKISGYILYCAVAWCTAHNILWYYTCVVSMPLTTVFNKSMLTQLAENGIKWNKFHNLNESTPNQKRGQTQKKMKYSKRKFTDLERK